MMAHHRDRNWPRLGLQADPGLSSQFPGAYPHTSNPPTPNPPLAGGPGEAHADLPRAGAMLWVLPCCYCPAAAALLMTCSCCGSAAAALGAPTAARSLAG
jgi:hypothetical protein